MADIELVIKIPEWKYKSICEGIEASKICGVVGIDPDVHEAIYNGTLLPKGHGRIIDESQVTGTFTWDNGFIECFATTIIEADKENKECHITE